MSICVQITGCDLLPIRDARGPWPPSDEKLLVELFERAQRSTPSLHAFLLRI